ncbi:MAG TPA: 1-deoxy-D-xylulose-5-phosphate synthase [Candidatus Eremiobacteraceae bacterium]|nr:1-deoxy-D-xylulose-5-phosphate synthase [Candidatus Eremiobacteraceae bacterium]
MYLERIAGPQDVAGMSHAERAALAGELRARIIEVCARNGGHVAPSLGVVELTLALHTVFQSPSDKIVWDVGHQAYAHKLLTGRNDRFDTLRQGGGISGFPERGESEHDHFGTAHASTAISAALGMAHARDLAGRSERIVAVVGDGALTGGLAYEALNNAGQLKTNFIVILNDNEFSIAPNVGAISAYLGMLRAHPLVTHTADLTKRLLRHVPFGAVTTRAIQSAETAARKTVSPLPKASVMFEEMGFTYIGPCNGHDTPFLIDALKACAKVDGPVLLHVLTVKGKGFDPAQGDARTYHGVAAFDATTGEFAKKSGPTFASTFAAEATQLAAHDPRVIAITAAMPDGTGLKEFAKAYPARFFDVGIAEAHATCFAAGAAAAGMRPIVAIYSTFLQRAYDQIVHDVCVQSLPVTFCIDRAGFVGDDGKTHQGAYDIAYLRTLPNIAIMSPSTEEELRMMLRYALALHDGTCADGASHAGPVAIRYPRGASAVRADRPAPAPIALGASQTLREGEPGGVAIVALGICCDAALAAADVLETEGIKPAVVNARFIRPLDAGMLERLAASHTAIITVEEHSLAGGFGSAVLECLSDRGLAAEVIRLGIADRFVSHASQAAQRQACGVDESAIVRAARDAAARALSAQPR